MAAERHDYALADGDATEQLRRVRDPGGGTRVEHRTVKGTVALLRQGFLERVWEEAGT